MRILQLTSDWKWTGPAEPMLHAVTGLRARGHDVDAAFPPTPAGHADGLAERARARGIEPAFQPAAGQGYLPLRDGGEVRRLRAFLREREYDVVHATHARAQLLARLALGAERSRTALVAAWTHGEPIPAWPWNWWLFGPSGCDGVAVLSERLAHSTRALAGTPPERVGVVSGAVDTARFAPRARRSDLADSLGLKPDHVAVGLVARLQPHRRVELVLESLRRALASAPGLRLLVVGRGTRAREVLDEPARRLGVDYAVLRAGYRRGDEYLDVLALMQALVFLVPGSDGSCRAVLETMAMGVPALVSRRGILPELVGADEAGVACEEDAAALAAQLGSIARDPAAWRARGEAARSRAVARFAIDRYAERCEALYADVVRSRQR
ncbi:MAG TPA: glycosyltransferase family 4 protein [Myxococcota bacterium]|nr:glycosyltransferase family 4 protein [Myxococcota bacterium]